MLRLYGTLDGSGLTEAFDRIASELDGQLEQTVDAVAQGLETAVRDTTPVAKDDPLGRRKGGQGRASIRFDLSGATATFFGISYLEYVIAGTEPHEIRARNAPALVFYWDKVGSIVHFVRVHHPGTKPNDFRDEALAQSDEIVQPELERLFAWVGEMVGR